MDMIPKFVYLVELLVALRTGVMVQRNVLGNTGGGLELSVAAGAGVSHCDNN